MEIHLNGFTKLASEYLDGKKAFRAFPLLVVVAMMVTCPCCQSKASYAVHHGPLATNQNIYVIERAIPGAGHLTQDELKAISQTSCNVLKGMGPDILWMHSYITGDKIYSVYAAPNEEMVREHARQGGFSVSSIELVSTIIDPSTATH